MSGFYSRSSSRRRYPDPNMGGKHYKKKEKRCMYWRTAVNSAGDIFLSSVPLMRFIRL